jgi:hypothetical protein
MSWPGLSWLLLGAVFLICFGILLGAAWTTRTIDPKLRQQAEERRRLNEERVAVRAAHQQLAEDSSGEDLQGEVAVVDPSDSPAWLSSASTGSGPISAGASGPGSGSFKEVKRAESHGYPAHADRDRAKTAWCRQPCPSRSACQTNRPMNRSKLPLSTF